MITFQEVLKADPFTFSSDDVASSLRSIPLSDLGFWNTLTARSANKICAIKEVRGKYNISLRTSKALVDAVYNGAFVKSAISTASPDLFTIMEDIESRLQRAVHVSEACGHSKASALFLRFKQEMHELWMEQFEIGTDQRLSFLSASADSAVGATA
jgi:hypothetical protein